VPIKVPGGVLMGFVRAPFARLTASAEELCVRSMVGTYRFSPDEVVALEVDGWSGIRIVHTNPEYPRKMIFSTWDSSQNLIGRIRDAGFLPSGTPASIPPREGIPVRWSFIIVATIVLHVLPRANYARGARPGLREFLDLGLVFAGAMGLPWSSWLQYLVLKPGRLVGEIRPMLILMRAISGLLLVVSAYQYFVR